MPKTNDSTGATYAGYEGIVEHADGRLSELDPSHNVDGSAVDGFQSEEREIEDREPAGFVTEPQPVDASPPNEDEKPDEKPVAGRGSRNAAKK